MVKNSRKTISIALQGEDYDLLYSVQQDYLFSGSSIGNIWQLGDILKAIVISTSADFFHPEIDRINLRLWPFLKAHNLPKNKLPKTNDEFANMVELYTNKSKLKLFMKLAGDSLQARKEETTKPEESDFGYAQVSGNISKSNKTNNFILSLTEEDLELFNRTKVLIEAYVGEITYPEMVRTFLRSVLSFSPESEMARALRFEFIARIYIGSLYSMTPQESILIFEHVSQFNGISLKLSALEKLKWLDRDSAIFKEYRSQLDRELHFPHERAEVRTKEKEKLVYRATNKTGGDKYVEYGYYEPGGFQLTRLDLNQEREDRFKSAVNGFGFHSAFIGYCLLFAEWHYEQHKLPLLTAYLIADRPVSEKDSPLRIERLAYAIQMYAVIDMLRVLNELYSISKGYREKGLSYFENYESHEQRRVE